MAEDEAKKAVKFLKDDGKLDVDAAGEAILVDFVAVVLAKKNDGAPVFGVNDRLKAGTAALQYLRAKPESKSTVRVETAEDFFAKAAQEAEEVIAP